MSLDSTAALNKAVVARLLGYVHPITGATLRTALGLTTTPSVYISEVPDGLAAPYVLLRVLNQRTRGIRLSGDIEAIVFVRPRAEQQKAEAAADLIVQALTTWRATPGTGAARAAVFGQDATRDTLPIGPAPADRDVVMIRVLASFVARPPYLTSLATPYT